MAKRTRKPPVKLDERREWLRRLEENGESVPQIARQDRFDIRTVRKQIELAQQERESREARLLVLRAAVEHHYGDLLKYVESLDPELKAGPSGLPPQDFEFLESALRQHLPRSPIWGYLSKLQQLRDETMRQRQAIKDAVQMMVAGDSRLDLKAGDASGETTANAVNALVFQCEQWSRGNIGLSVGYDIHIEPFGGEGKARIRYGAFGITIAGTDIAGRLVETLRGVLEDLESRLKQSAEYLALEKTIAEIARVERKLREELAIIRLRRIVPGRCKYCPL